MNRAFSFLYHGIASHGVRATRGRALGAGQLPTTQAPRQPSLKARSRTVESAVIGSNWYRSGQLILEGDYDESGQLHDRWSAFTESVSRIHVPQGWNAMTGRWPSHVLGHLVPHDPALIGSTVQRQARFSKPLTWSNRETTTVTGL